MPARIVQLVTLAASPLTGNFIKPVAVAVASRASEDRGSQHGVRAELNFRSLADAKAAWHAMIDAALKEPANDACEIV
jgi:hypothetical protein